MTDNFSDDSSLYFPVEYEENHTVSLKRKRFSKPKVCDSAFWSNENITKLIAAVKVQPAIWQTESKGFKIRACRETAWQQVAESFGEEMIDPNQLIAKWQNLRIQYRSVKNSARKYAENRIGKKPVWRFYSQMAFIDNGQTSDVDDDDKANSSHEKISSNKEQEVTKFKVQLEQNHRVVDSALWDDQNVIKLIGAVKQRKSIWNFNDQDYKDRGIRESDWQNIDDEFNNRIPIKQLAAKWQNLRTTYRSAKNSARKLRTEHGIIRKPHWKFYPYMTFIDAVEKDEKDQMEEVEEFEIKSLVESEENIFDEVVSSEFLNQSEFNDSAIKNELCEEVEVVTNDTLEKTEPDGVEEFGIFFISELRKIKNQAYREATQRQILQFLWQCMDKEPVSPKK